MLAPRHFNHPQKEGWRAYFKGREIDDNPHQTDTQPWSRGRWDIGWLAAEQQGRGNAAE